MNRNLACALVLSLMPLPGFAAHPAASIGVATMSADGTIRLQLAARSDDGAVGDALLIYRVGDPQYDDVLKHVGGIKPGEEKPVPPWPAASNQQPNESSP